MGTSLHTSTDVDADVATVFAVFTSAAWPQALDARLHDGSTLVSADPTDDGGTRVVFRRKLPAGIPSFLQRFAPKDGTVTQTDVWGPERDGARDGTWSVAFPGSPGQITGTTRIAPQGSGSRWTVDGTVTVKVPLLGGKAEGFLAPLVESLLGKQAEVLRTLV